MQHKILIVDDEIDIVNMLKQYFQMNGFMVYTANCGKEALNMAEKQPDIILLDVNMPGMNGLEVCTAIRNFVHCPILFLTAKVEENDKVNGFTVGGDDYIVKPFSIKELGARVNAHLRRELRQKNSSKIKFDNELAIDYAERCVYYKNVPLNFAKKEFNIIELLSQNPNQIFDKERIYEKLWGYDSEGDSSVIVEHIRRIRSKFNLSSKKQYIETVWGVGYKWVN